MVVRRLVAALLFLPVLVSCSDDDPDSPDAGDPTTPVTSATPTETPPPTEPPEAGDRTKAGAKAFVEYWVATLNYAAATGETTEFAGLGTASCNSCNEIARLVDSTYEDGGYIRSHGWRVIGVPSIERAGRTMVVLADLKFAPETTVPWEGADPEFRAGAIEGATFELTWSSSGWLLDQFSQGY